MTAHRLDRLEREDVEATRALRQRKRHAADCQRMVRAGFARAQAPFAASAFRVLSMIGGDVSASAVRARVRGQYPWMFENDNEESA